MVNAATHAEVSENIVMINVKKLKTPTLVGIDVWPRVGNA